MGVTDIATQGAGLSVTSLLEKPKPFLFNLLQKLGQAEPIDLW